MEERGVSLLEMLKSLWNSLMLPEYSGLHNPPSPLSFQPFNTSALFPASQLVWVLLSRMFQCPEGSQGPHVPGGWELVLLPRCHSERPSAWSCSVVALLSLLILLGLKCFSTQKGNVSK